MSISRDRGATLLLALLLAGCASRGAPPARPAEPASFFSRSAGAGAPRPLSREQGQRLFASLCVSCHGETGQAGTPLARDLQPAPADFSRCSFKYRSTPSGSLPVRADLVRTLAVGLPGTAMPSFGALLPVPALLALAAEVEDRCDRFTDEAADPSLSIGSPPLYGPESVGRGQTVYRREGCGRCHGEQGRGDGPVAGALKDGRGQPVRPRDHTRGVFRSGFGRADLYRAFSTGLDGTPMPALPPELPASQRWDLAHYLVSLSADRSKLWRALQTPPSWYEPARAWGLPWR